MRKQNGASSRNWADITEESDRIEKESQWKASMVWHMKDGSREMRAPSLQQFPSGQTGLRHENRTLGTKGKQIQNSPQPQDFHQQMLQKLALHLAAQPHPLHESNSTDEIELKSSHDGVIEIGEDKVQCDCMIADLEPSLDATRAARAASVMAWIQPAARTLSLTQSGSRLVQKAIDVASLKQLDQLAENLLKDTTELYTSPHANHVLAKLIEVMPRGRLVCIGEAMRGKATTVARHQFGSRILESVIVHCTKDQIGYLLDELLEDLEALARHQFGNFVVQRLFEHGTEAWKDQCFQKLLPHVLHHATHKTACNVVQRMLDHANLSCQAVIADAFLAGEGKTSLETIAATRYGSFVVQHLVDRFHPRIDAVKARVKAAHPKLQESTFSQRKIIDHLGEAFFKE